MSDLGAVRHKNALGGEVFGLGWRYGTVGAPTLVAAREVDEDDRYPGDDAPVYSGVEIALPHCDGRYEYPLVLSIDSAYVADELARLAAEAARMLRLRAPEITDDGPEGGEGR